MNKIILKKSGLLFLAFFLAWSTGIKSQGFSYSTSIDSSVTYQDLVEPVSLNAGNKWQQNYKIPVGFSFPFNGKTTDTVSFMSNGFLLPNRQLSYAVMAFNNFYCKRDSNSNYSALSYKLSGTQGSRVLKVECRNTGQSDNPRELLSYQLWLKENGGIEIFIGSNTYEPQNNEPADTMQVIRIGIINRNMDTSERGLFISGTPSSPASAPLNDEHPEIAFLKTIPKKGYRYIFTPVN